MARIWKFYLPPLIEKMILEVSEHFNKSVVQSVSFIVTLSKNCINYAKLQRCLNNTTVNLFEFPYLFGGFPRRYVT